MTRHSLVVLGLVGCTSGASPDAGAADGACTITLEEVRTGACSPEGKRCMYDCVPAACGGYELLGPLYATCQDGSWFSSATWDVYYQGLWVDSRCTIQRPLDGGRVRCDAGGSPDASGD